MPGLGDTFDCGAWIEEILEGHTDAAKSNKLKGRGQMLNISI